MEKIKKSLNKKDKENIKKLLYRTSLREGESIVQNSSRDISNELNLDLKAVQYYIAKCL